MSLRLKDIMTRSEKVLPVYLSLCSSTGGIVRLKHISSKNVQRSSWGGDLLTHAHKSMVMLLIIFMFRQFSGSFL